jgi:hypothetical protein
MNKPLGLMTGYSDAATVIEGRSVLTDEHIDRMKAQGLSQGITQYVGNGTRRNQAGNIVIELCIF